MPVTSGEVRLGDARLTRERQIEWRFIHVFNRDRERFGHACAVAIGSGDREVDGVYLFMI